MRVKKWDIMMHRLLTEQKDARVIAEKTFAGKKELDKDGDGVPKWADKDDSDPKVGSKTKKSSKKKGKIPPQLRMHIAKKKKKSKIDEAIEYLEKILIENKNLDEAEEKKQPRLGKVTRNPAGSKKKFHVYVKCDGRVKKISFGDPGLSIKRDSPARRKNFRARHKCDKPAGKDRCTARYWSCYQWRAGKKVEGEE